MTEGILTIAVVIAATAAAGMFIQSNLVLTSSQAYAFQDTRDAISTSIRIVFATNSSEDEFKIWVKNVGRNEIYPGSIQRFDLFFGRKGAATYIPFNGTATGWAFLMVNDVDLDGNLDPGETLEITISVPYAISAGDYQVKVSTHNGVADTFYFSV